MKKEYEPGALVHFKKTIAFVHHRDVKWMEVTAEEIIKNGYKEYFLKGETHRFQRSGRVKGTAAIEYIEGPNQPWMPRRCKESCLVPLVFFSSLDIPIEDSRTERMDFILGD